MRKQEADMVVKAEYLIDKKGKKKSVVLPLQNYMKIMEYMETLEDSLELKKAKAQDCSFKDFSEISNRLKHRL